MQATSVFLPAGSHRHASTGLISQICVTVPPALRIAVLLLVTVTVMTSVVACSGGKSSGSTTTTTPTTYTIGGTVSGLTGTGLVLQDNGGNNLSVSASGSFTFTTAIASGGAYSVTVLTQPTRPNLHGDQRQRNGQRQCDECPGGLLHAHLHHWRHSLRTLRHGPGVAG